MLALLLIAVVIVRAISILKTTIANKREKIASNYIFRYMAENITLKEISDYLKDNPTLKPIFIELLKELAENLDGDDRERIEEVFHLPQVYKFYLKKLESDKPAAISEAMKFFRALNYLTPNVKNKIFALIREKNHRIAYGAASSLGSADDAVMKTKALKIICQRNDISRVSVLELFFILAPEVDDLVHDAAHIEGLLTDEEISLEKRAVLIRGVGELNQVEYAPFLYGYLLELRNKEYPNSYLIGVLVEALGKFHYLDIQEIIKDLIKENDADLKVYSAKALGALGDKNSIILLKELLNDSSMKVRTEAMKQVIGIGIKALEYLSNGRKNISQIQQQTMMELKEISANLYA